MIAHTYICTFLLAPIVCILKILLFIVWLCCFFSFSLSQLFTSDSYTSLIQVLLEDSSSLSLQSLSAWGSFLVVWQKYDNDTSPYLPLINSHLYSCCYHLPVFAPLLSIDETYTLLFPGKDQGLACDLMDLSEAFMKTGCHDTNNHNNTCMV